MAVLLGAGLVLRVITTFTYRPAMQFVQDSLDYLHDAEQMVPSVIRPLGYPLFLRVLSVTGRLGVVPVAQHRYFVAGRVSPFPDCTALDPPPAGIIGATLLERRLRR